MDNDISRTKEVEIKQKSAKIIDVVDHEELKISGLDEVAENVEDDIESNSEVPYLEETAVEAKVEEVKNVGLRITQEDLTEDVDHGVSIEGATDSEVEEFVKNDIFFVDDESKEAAFSGELVSESEFEELIDFLLLEQSAIMPNALNAAVVTSSNMELNKIVFPYLFAKSVQPLSIEHATLTNAKSNSFVGEIYKLSTRSYWQKRWILVEADTVTLFHGKKFDLKKVSIGDLEFKKFCLKRKMQFLKSSFSENSYFNKKENCCCCSSQYYFHLVENGVRKYFKCDRKSLWPLVLE